MPPFLFVIFGATGDLTAHQLIPALYELMRLQLLPDNFACIAFARRDKNDSMFRNEIEEKVKQVIPEKDFHAAIWKEIKNRIYYHQSEFQDDQGYSNLHKLLNTLDKRYNTLGNRVYYYSVHPKFYSMISKKLFINQCIHPFLTHKNSWSKVLIEKPFGADHHSAIELNQELLSYFHTEQIYLVDHFLEKQSVKNILNYRILNKDIETFWNRDYIEKIVINLSESIGINTRGNFYEEQGCLRDMVQSHLLQLAALVLMDLPTHLTSEAIHQEKMRVLQNIALAPNLAIRGQYGAGTVDGEEVVGYREEENVSSQSNRETFVYLQLQVASSRWRNVPLILKTGKRLDRKLSEVSVHFRPTDTMPPLHLTFQIYPHSDIFLSDNEVLSPYPLNLNHAKEAIGNHEQIHPPLSPYSHVIKDCVEDRRIHFSHPIQAIASWHMLSPLLKEWDDLTDSTFPNYPAGSQGPASAHPN